jgi:trk system potassium uptake protein TrkA
VSVLEEQSKGRIAFITRLGSGMIPTQDTVIQEGDYLAVFLREDRADETHAVLERGPAEED